MNIENNNHRDSKKIRSALLKKISGDDQMFALGASIAKVIEMTSSEDQGTRELTYYVLSDPALSQRVLRLANAAIFRGAAGSPVTNISRAITVLGLERVKSAAVAMLLVDALSCSQHAHSVKREIKIALCASLVGREIARIGIPVGAEDASMSSLFKNLGALLVATHEHDLYLEISSLAKELNQTQEKAAYSVLGVTYDSLTTDILTEWKIPDTIVRSISPLLGSSKKSPQHRSDWLRLVAAFSAEVGRDMVISKFAAKESSIQNLKKEYSASLGLGSYEFSNLYSNVKEEINVLLAEIEDLDAEGEQNEDTSLPDFLIDALMTDGGNAEVDLYPSGKPKNAPALLLNALQEVTRLRATQKGDVNQIISAAIKGIHDSMGFRFTAICLRNDKASNFSTKICFGSQGDVLKSLMSFPLASSRDIFHLSMENSADLTIDNSNSPKIKPLLPKWHSLNFPDVKSMMILPLDMNGKKLGVIYGDRIVIAEEGITQEEAGIIRAIKTQMLLAMMP